MKSMTDAMKISSMHMFLGETGDAGQRDDCVYAEACGSRLELPAQCRATHHPAGAALSQSPAGQQLQSAPV